MKLSKEILTCLDYTKDFLEELKVPYEVNRLNEDIIVCVKTVVVEFTDEGIIISKGDNLELCYYLEEFDVKDLVYFFKRDFELVLKGIYPPNKTNFIDKLFVTHFKPDPFSRNNSFIKVGVLLIIFIYYLYRSFY